MVTSSTPVKLNGNHVGVLNLKIGNKVWSNTYFGLGSKDGTFRYETWNFKTKNSIVIWKNDSLVLNVEEMTFNVLGVDLEL